MVPDVLDHDIAKFLEDIVDEGLCQGIGDHFGRVCLHELGCAVSHFVLEEPKPNEIMPRLVEYL